MTVCLKKIIGFAVILALTAASYILSSNILLIVLDFILMILIVRKAKLSFFSVSAVVSTYPLVAVICEYYFDFSYGLLHLSSLPIHIYEISMCILIMDLSIFYMVFFTDSLPKEKEMLAYIPTKCSKLVCEIFAVLSVVLVIIAFPYGFLSFENRQQALLKGQAWMLLALYSLFFSINYAKKSLLIRLCCLFTIVWYALHAERVEFIGFLIMLITVYVYRKKVKMNTKWVVLYAAVTFCLIVFMAFIGNYVRGTSTNASAIFKSVFLQGSMVDMMHVFNTGVDYVANNGTINGKTLIVYIDKIFLYASSDNSYTKFLRNYEYNAGGGYALTDGYLNFGYIGVFIQVLILNIWVRFCLNKQSNYRYFCYCFLFSLCFRYSWYGYYYYEKTPIIYVPIFLLLMEIINGLVRRKFDIKMRM